MQAKVLFDDRLQSLAMNVRLVHVHQSEKRPCPNRIFSTSEATSYNMVCRPPGVVSLTPDAGDVMRHLVQFTQ